MNDMKYKLRQAMILPVPVSEAEALVASGSGDAALLYLYLLRAGGELDVSRAAFDLRRTEKDVRAAADRLRELGILTGAGQTLPPAEDLPEYSASEVSRRSAESTEFQALVEETQRVYGRLLSSTELKTLFGIWDYLALPADVIMMLIHACADETAVRCGDGKKPSFRTIEKEAYIWVNREIITYERAEYYLAEKAQRNSQKGELRKALGIAGRALSPTEEKYIDAWLAMGFGTQALAEAYDRTVVKTGELKWKYMDSIVRSWDSKGLHTPDEIINGDRKPALGRQDTSAQPLGREELERMKKLREKIRNGT